MRLIPLLVAFGLILPVALSATAQNDRAFAVVPQAGPLKGKQVYANSYALIVGVNAYPNVPRKWWLSHAVDDARAMKEMLVRYYGFPAGNITLLTDGDATEKKIRSALAGFTSSTRIKKDDRILVFFSGHGQTLKLPGDAPEMGFLIPYDAEVDLSDLSNPEPYLRTCIPMRQVWEYLDTSPAKHVLVLADACYSGLLAKTRAFGEENLSDAQLQSLAAERTRQVITAGRKGETAVELDALGHGAFTHSLLDLLKKGAATPGDVFTSNQLYTKLFPAVGKVTQGKQTPQLSNHETEGQFLFIATPEQRVENGPAAEDTIARVFVKTDPPGAKIFVDGREFTEGKTPFTIAIGLGGDKVRSVEIAVELNGERKSSKLALVAGRFIQLPLLQFTGRGNPDTDPGSPFKAGEVRVNPKDGAEMVWIPGGEFVMGVDPAEIDAFWSQTDWPLSWKAYRPAWNPADEGPAHRVRVRGFWMYRTELTIGQYRKFCTATGRTLPNQGTETGDNYPVRSVTWEDAKAYCDWAGVRLPTEAEWERAARGTYTGANGRPRRTFAWGDEVPRGNSRLGNFMDASVKRVKPGWSYLLEDYDDGFPGAAPVASFPPSEWGLYDLTGNVYEWTADWFAPDYYAKSEAVDPQGPTTGTMKTRRGGSFFYFPMNLRLSARSAGPPTGKDWTLGFRPAKSQ